MSGDDLLIQDVAETVLWLRLNRPAVLNALNRDLIQALRAALADAKSDPSVNVVVLGSTEPKAFSAGMDVKETLGGTNDTDERLYDLQWELESFTKPVIAELSGHVLGGGAEIALSADIRVGAPTTRFSFPATGYGLAQGSWHLIDVVGWSRAKELVLTGRVVQAQEAVRLGLLHEIHPDPGGATTEIARHVAARSATSMRAIKNFFLESGSRSLEERFALERDFNVAALRSEEVRERMARPRPNAGLSAQVLSDDGKDN